MGPDKISLNCLSTRLLTVLFCSPPMFDSNLDETVEYKSLIIIIIIIIIIVLIFKG